MEKKDYSPLFTPFRIGSMEVKNRIVLSPMGQKAATPYGAKTECEAAYFAWDIYCQGEEKQKRQNLITWLATCV